jgi:hypothetical protein
MSVDAIATVGQRGAAAALGMHSATVLSREFVT